MIMFFEGYGMVTSGSIQAGLNIILPATIFLIIFLFANLVVVFAFFEDPNNLWLRLSNDTPEDMATGFLVGFLGWALLLKGKTFSFLGNALSFIPELKLSTVLSTASTELTTAQNYLISGIMAPFLEEILFLSALGAMIWYLFNILGLENKLIKVILSLGIISVLFAQFHTFADPFTQFWIIAVVFSVLIRGLALFDLTSNIIPGFAVFLSFTVGAHMANNMIQLAGGIIPFFQGLTGNTLYFVLVSGVFVLNFYWAGKRIYSVVS